MAKIVLIDDGTKLDSNNIYDIVDIYNSNVDLGDSYSNFKIVEVPNLTKQEIVEELSKKNTEDHESKYPYSMAGLIPEKELQLKEETDKQVLLSIISQIKINS